MLAGERASADLALVVRGGVDRGGCGPCGCGSQDRANAQIGGRGLQVVVGRQSRWAGRMTLSKGQHLATCSAVVVVLMTGN